MSDVERAAAVQGRDQREGHGDDGCEERRHEGQHRRDRKALQDQLRHGQTQDHRSAEVAGEQASQIEGELLEDGAIDAHRLTHALDRLAGRPLAEKRDGRIARQEMRQHEDQHHRQHQCRHDLRQTAPHIGSRKHREGDRR